MNEFVSVSELIYNKDSNTSNTQSIINYRNGGMVSNLEKNGLTSVTYFGDQREVKMGMICTRSTHLSTVRINLDYEPLGRVVDTFGQFIDNTEDNILVTRKGKMILLPIEIKGAAIIDRSPIKENLPTGTKIVDSMVPIGRGQRELIIGDKKTGKTTLAIDMILNQKKENTNNICIYVAIGQKYATVIRIANLLRNKDCLSGVTLVFSGAADASSMQFLAPYAGCALAE
jgi:F-type H+-transporting ATPase subunit alpha